MGVNSGKVLERKLKRPGNPHGGGAGAETRIHDGGEHGLASSFSWGGRRRADGKQKERTVTISGACAFTRSQWLFSGIVRWLYFFFLHRFF